MKIFFLSSSSFMPVFFVTILKSLMNTFHHSDQQSWSSIRKDKKPPIPMAQAKNNKRKFQAKEFSLVEASKQFSKKLEKNLCLQMYIPMI